MINNNSIPRLIRFGTIELHATNLALVLFPIVATFFMLVIIGVINWDIPDLFIPHRKEILIYFTVPLMILSYPLLFKFRKYLIRKIAGLCWRAKRHLKDLQIWSYMIRQRDGFACVYCGSNKRLNAHHIAPKAIYPELKYDIDNGVTVCEGCHHFAADVFRRLQMVCTITSKG